MKVIALASLLIVLLNSTPKEEFDANHVIENKTWFFVVKAESPADTKNRFFIASKRDGSTFYHKLELMNEEYKLDGDRGTYNIEDGSGKIVLKSKTTGATLIFKILFSSADYLTLQDEKVDVSVFYCVQAPE